MKTQIALIVSTLMVGTTQAGINDMSTSDFESMVNGYIDGVLGVDQESQLGKCEYPAIHAKI